MTTDKQAGAEPQSANPVNDGTGPTPPIRVQKSANPVNDSANPVNDVDPAPRGDKGNALGQTAGS